MREPCQYRRSPSALAIALAIAAASAASAPAPSAAQPRAAGQASPAASGEILGVVLAIEDDELILDLGSSRGASDGQSVQLWRPLKLTHPVTGEVFTDRFLIGTLELKQVRPNMSIAGVTGTLSRDPQKGDIVIMGAPAAAPPGAPPSAPAPGAAGGAFEAIKPEDSEAAAMGKMLDNLRGSDPVQRIRVYEDYVRTQPKGRFARFLYEEAQALRRIYELERQKQAEPAEKKPAEDAVLVKSFVKPAEAVAGSPLGIGLELNDKAAGAILHYRVEDDQAYTSVPMAQAGPGYFSATIPQERVKGSTLRFFIEAATPQGRAIPVVASSEVPEEVTLLKPPAPPPSEKRVATVSLLTDYADYNRFEGNDRVWQTEGYFQLRYGDTGVRALRTGFGVYRGVGGTVAELDELKLKPRSVGLTYGYLETEVGAFKSFSIIGRAVVGLDEDGVAGGGQILFRIGNDLQTNLVLGGELLGGVGLRGITQLELNTFRRFPILLRIEVTNQPAGARASREQIFDETVSQGAGEVGGRGIVQVGMRIVDPLVVSVRGSFQGRTINHAGPGFGAAVSYQW